MNLKGFRLSLLAAGVSFIAACSATAGYNNPVSKNVLQPLNVPPPVAALVNKSDPKGITLEKIMSDPDWFGRQPSNGFWADDSKSIFYGRKREASPISDVWQISLDETEQQENGEIVPLTQAHLLNQSRVYSKDRTQIAWIYDNSVFHKDLSTKKVRQLTGQLGSPYDVKFAADNQLIYSDAGAIYSVSLDTGFVDLVMRWHFAEEPEALDEPADYIAEEQIKLMQYVASERDKRKQRFEYREDLKAQNPVHNNNIYYFDDSYELVEVSISPNLDKAIFVITEDVDSRSASDIMPNYIKENGRIKAEEVRRRVADAKPINHEVWYVDLKKQTKTQFDYDSLEGFDEDVLAAVKKENAERKGEEYQPENSPRDITLMLDWYWDQSAIQWSSDGSQVAVMLEAWDNKDRWIVTVDWASGEFQQQHRLHDNAWINYKFNSFGWLNQSNTLYYLSEESGFANLYRKTPGAEPIPLTPGNYEVDELTVTKDDKYVYFQANKKHPGIYEIYRLTLADGSIEAVTNLNGMTTYELSPDESQILLIHSKLTLPPELYVADANINASVERLTNTVSKEFLSYDWVAPQIVPVPSSHGEKPVYSRVYLPKAMPKDKAYPAVIFNHGAGYLQNAHLGWSGYFREFMFHSYLVQQGYVVMDMDYRASMGYGRDWRTEIYRQMGTPEIQDLQDGVNWMVDNVQVARDRIGTYGGSYGGFMTFMALFTKPELFQAGASLRPVTDWAHYNIPYTSNILNLPDNDPIAYERSSPIYFAEGLQKPLLINAPMIDDNVFFVDVVRLVQRLIELEKEDFETAIYPVEPHGFREPSSWLDEYRRIYKLMETHVK